MTEVIRTRNAWRSAATVLIALLVLLAVALASSLQPAATTGSSSPAIHPGVHATIVGGPDSTDDPYIDRHAKVVAAYQGSPR
jgi:hypothetical protein